MAVLQWRRRGAARGHAQGIVLRDVGVGARPVQVDRVSEVTDDVAIGEVGVPTDVVVRPTLSRMPWSAAVAVHRAGAGEAEQVAQDAL